MERFTPDTIDSMTEDDLIEGVYQIFETQDYFTREAMTFRMSARARKLGILTQFRRLLKAAETDEKKSVSLYGSMNSKVASGMKLSYGQNGKPAETIENYLEIMRNDPYFITFRFNQFKLRAEITENLVTRQWSDADDSAALCYIESAYKLSNENRYQHAMRMLQNERAYHPIKDYIDALEWDGQPRMANFLHRYFKCEDTPYTREVSRLIFAGGIHRIYDKGCKFDYVPVLIGKFQGEGKSTIVCWLAIKDEWYGELTDFEGARGIEAIQGKWVCEIGELLAMVRAKEAESIKAYITRRVDTYRAPYDRHVTSYERQCIFVGTTNKERFLTDKTGNRRFLPVRVDMAGYDLSTIEKECREYIDQCWAEARANYNKPLTKLIADKALIEEIVKRQQSAEEDDWREGMIQEYLYKQPNGTRICTLELWQEALGYGTFSRPTPAETNAIGLIMQKMPNWTRPDGQTLFANYGKQRYWVKQEKEEELPF